MIIRKQIIRNAPYQLPVLIQLIKLLSKLLYFSSLMIALYKQ